jgi:hypothetical protein
VCILYRSPQQQMHDNTPNNEQKQEIATQANFYTKITDPIQAIQVMGEMIAGSGMFGCTKTEQGMVLAMQCLAEGKAPLELAKTYHIIEGKLSMRADAMLGGYLSRGGKVKWTERSDKRVAAIWTCDGNDLEIAITFDEMVKNGVAGPANKIKQNWQRFPRQMLTARCISEAVRLLMPQIVSGIYTPEEVIDFTSSPSPVQVRPQAQTQQATHADFEIIDEPSKVLVERLDGLLLKYEPKASNYLIEKGYLRNGQNYRDLDAMTAQRFLASPSKMIGILEGLK